MAIADDFTIDYTNKRVTHTSGATVYEAIDLYSHLMDVFDELAQMDDPVPMTAQTPTEFTFVNGWFMEYPSFEYLKGGAIKTDGWKQEAGEDDGVRIFELTDYNNCIAGDVGKAVVGGTTGDSGVLLAYDNTDKKMWVRPDGSADIFDDNSEDITVTAGTGSGVMTKVSATGENLWSNLYTLGTLESGTLVYIVQDEGKLNGWWPEGHIDVLILVKEADVEIGSAELTVFARQYQKLYDHFPIDVTEGGRNAVPVATAADLNNETGSGTVSGYNDIVIAQVDGKLAYTGVGGFPKWVTVTGESSGHAAIVLDDNMTADDLILGNATGVFQDGESLISSGAGSGSASGTMDYATKTCEEDLNNGNGVQPYDIHVKCATRPVAEMYEYFKFVNRRTSEFTFYQNNGSGINELDGEQYIRAQEVYSPVKASPLGTFAGGTYFGARGVWIEEYDSDDAKNFQLIDSDGDTQTPPNVVSIKVTALGSADRVAVFVLTAAEGEIEKNTYNSHDSNNVSAATTFEVEENIASDTPASGFLRAVDVSDDYKEYLYEYSSWSGKIFTLASGTLGNLFEDGDKAYVPIIDKESGAVEVSNTLTYDAVIPVLVRVRKKGILPFEVESSITDVGMSVAAIRTPDNIVEFE